MKLLLHPTAAALLLACGLASVSRAGEAPAPAGPPFKVTGKVRSVWISHPDAARPGLAKWVVELELSAESAARYPLQNGVMKIPVHSVARSFLTSVEDLAGADVSLDCAAPPAAVYVKAFQCGKITKRSVAK